jgi:hypothetical protein
MRIHGRCTTCKGKISQFTLYDTRVEYEMRKRTKHVNIKCKHCYNSHDYHLNDLKAIRSPLFGLAFAASIVVGLFTTFFLEYYLGSSTQWTIVGWVVGIPIAGCGIAFQQNMMKVNAFNQNFVKY